MGPVKESYNQAAGPAATINHFSHHHQLHLSHHHTPQTPCSACTHPTSSGATYACQHCNYYLHASCAKMPQQLQHPFDTNKTHFLTLLPKPAYPDGLFRCDACGHHGSGFSYHCAECSIDLHGVCAALPAVMVVAGHQCELRMMFSVPYPNGKFICDVCAMPGSNTWLYQCDACLYDVHLGCAKRAPQLRAVVEGRPVNPPAPYNNLLAQYNHQAQYNHPQAAHNRPVQSTARPGPHITNSLVEGAVEGIASAVAGNLVNMVMGGITGVDCSGAAGGYECSAGGCVEYETAGASEGM